MKENSLIMSEEMKVTLTTPKKELIKAINEGTSALSDIETKHKFIDGMYYREMIARKGSIIVGAEHKKSCFNMLTKGSIAISNEKECVVLTAPQTFVGAAGTSKIGIALSDVIWVNVFRTDATSVEEAEKELYVEKTMDSQIASDYTDMLNDIGMTEEEVQEYVHLDNVIETQRDIYEKRDSKIHGTGVFATRDIEAGELIGYGSIDNTYRTTLRRWTNHSGNNNAQFFYKDDGNVIMYATRDILGGTEILVNYRDTMMEKRRQLWQEL